MKKATLANSILILFFLLYSITPLSAQQNIPIFGKQQLINGYEKDVNGEVITYYSSYLYFAKDALLTRCTDGKKTISWKTASLPSKLDKDYYYFYWLSGHSSGTSGTDRKFNLEINGKTYLSFTTPANKKPPFTWSFTGKDSVTVIFEATKTDVHKDLFGNMYLRVPKKILNSGKPLTISITGNADKSNDWFMVFRYSYSEKIIITPTPFLVKTNNGIKQLLQVNVDHIYPEEKTMTITINNKTTDVPITTGFNNIEFPVDTITKTKILIIDIKIGSKISKEITVIQNPVQRREVDIIHHSHNDIGYSHVQQEVIKIQNQNILDALDMIERTTNYPAGSRFVWNMETIWPVEYFLKQATEKDKTRFINAVKNKQIALSAFYVGVMTGLCSPNELKWINEYAVYLKKNYNFPINTAMLSDIPGLSWSITDALLNDSIMYLSNGPNYIPVLPDKGDRIGSIYRYLGDKPFYWKTTTGKNKLLVWTAGLGYSAFHQIPMPDLGNKITEKLIYYLNELDSTQYPYDMIQLRYTIKSDNGPIDTNLSNFVRDWNIKYVSPKLVIANVSEMMQRFEQKYKDKLPVLSGDFTPYWEDGAYSTAAEEGENRILSDKLQQLMKLSEMLPQKQINPEWFYEARKNIIMFHEHTWGAWNSISDPDEAFAVYQWIIKKSFIDSTKKYIQMIESILIPEVKLSKNLTVYNTLPWARTGIIETTLPRFVTGNALIDEKGDTIPIQYLSDGNACFFAENIPAYGFKKYKYILSSKTAKIPEAVFTFKIDSTTGVLNSLNYLNKEWINTKEFKGLNQVLYIKGLDPKEQTTSTAFYIEIPESGNFKKTISAVCKIDGANQLTYNVSFYHGLNYVKFSCIIDKKSVREKEAIHIAFPFNINNPLNRIGISDTFYIPGNGQIPGSNKDFYSVQRWLDMSNANKGVTVCSPQGALFEIGKITDERPLNKGVRIWKDKAETSSTLFLYVLNNYWNTNFKADQNGIIQFDCYILFHNTFDIKEANKFGNEIHFPLFPVWE